MRRLVLLVLCCLTLSAQGATEMRVVNVEASGVNREDAIFNALGEAVRQVHGAKVNASREIRSSMERLSVRDTQGREASVTHETEYRNGTSIDSQGLISGYSVRSVGPAPGGGMLARLEVKVPVYHTPGAQTHDSRRRIAVYPVEVTQPRYHLAGQALAAPEVSQRLTQAIVQALVQSRRFAVLDRDMQAAIRAEKRLIAHGDVPLHEKAMLGNTLGADYLVVTRLADMDLDLREVRSQLTGEHSYQPQGTATLEARIVVPATGQVMWSHTLDASLEDLGVDDPSETGLEQRIFDALGNEITFRALNVIYPLRVVESHGNEIVLNQGGTLIQTGQHWEVFNIGKAYSDPYTGESLGPRENWTADVEVTRVADKIAYARVIKGEVDGNGQVLRRLDDGNSRKEARLESIRGTRERVCLPMDPC